MKVLFVGEGPHDVGPPDFAPGVRAASGAIATLARRICPDFGSESVSIFWREVPVLSLKRKGWAAKVRSAVALAIRNECQGTICVADRDRDEDRLPAMDEGVRDAAAAAGTDHRIVCGVAIESIEAWILGAPTALAGALGLEPSVLERHYRPQGVEQLYQRSGKAEKRSKDILDTIAGLKGENAGTEFRQRVAERADATELEQNCPNGFKPFADRLRAAFGPRG